jgi:hypothetical protein
VGDRIERQAAEHLGRPIPQPESDEGVAELVDREADEEHDGDDDRRRDDRLGEVQTAPGLRVPRIVAGLTVSGVETSSQSGEELRLLAFVLLR